MVCVPVYYSGFQVLCNLGQQVKYNCNVLLTQKPLYIFEVTIKRFLSLLWSFVCVNVSLCNPKASVKDRPERTEENRSILQCSVLRVCKWGQPWQKSTCVSVLLEQLQN